MKRKAMKQLWMNLKKLHDRFSNFYSIIKYTLYPLKTIQRGNSYINNRKYLGEVATRIRMLPGIREAKKRIQDEAVRVWIGISLKDTESEADDAKRKAEKP